MTKITKGRKAMVTSLSDGRNVTRRDFMDRAATLGVSAAVLAGAGASLFPSEAQANTPKKGGHFRIGLASGNTTDTFDPALKGTEFTGVATTTFQNQLVEVDTKGGLIPELAESWGPGDDAATWIFNLRKGVEFHDGKSFDAQDCIDTLKYHAKPKSKSSLKTLLNVIKEMKTDGPHRLIFTLNEPNAYFPYLMSTFRSMSCKDGVPYSFSNGTGGYILDKFIPGERLTMVRNPNYWREGLAHFDSIEEIAILDPTARQNALITGEVDVINRPDRKTWKRIDAMKGLTAVKINAMMHRTWPMRVHVPPFDNVDVRLALKYAVDREELVDKVLNGTGSVGNDHPISPVNKFYNHELEQRVYDPDKAKFHLKKAGMENLEVTLSTSEAIWEGALDAAVLYSESAKKAGIKLNVNKVPNDGYWVNIWRKDNHPFAACYWSGRPTEDWMFTMAYSAEANWNDTKWNNPRFNELLKAARGELDENRARDMYWEMQQLVRDDGASVIPIFADFIIAHSDKLGHGELAGNWDLDGYRICERWWFK